MMKWAGFLLLIFSFSAPAAADQTLLPDAMMFDGKQIDPTCVYAAIYHHRNKEAAELKSSCSEIYRLQGNDLGLPVTQGELESGRLGSLGYTYNLGDGRSGGFFYRYVGQTAEGLILNASYSSGGSGHWSELGVYERKGDTLQLRRRIVSGDRCSGAGGNDAVIENGQLFYSYAATASVLYRHYHPAAPRTILDDGPINCMAQVYAKDGVIQKIELEESAQVQDCFKARYLEQITQGKVLNGKDARTFIEEYARACAMPQQ